jgi:hypothetical protein
MKNIFLLLLLLSFNSFAQMPIYYNGIDFTKNGSELQDGLSQLIASTHTNPLPYTSSSPDTWDAVKQTDLVPGDTENVLLFYGYNDFDGVSMTDYTRDKDLSCHTSSCIGLFNREHVYAKSIATPSLTTSTPDSGTDAHNLKACDSQMNSSRSNKLFEDDSGDSHITSSGEWYPGDEWKGDVARIIMYMHLRYTSQCPANDIGTGTNTNHADMPDLFLQWNIDDPVSAYETQRNPILESMQGNRNPFIDNPYIATKLWGGNNAEDTWNLLSTDDYILNKISIYPTLVSERLYILNITVNSLDIVIYNINGQKIETSITNNYIEVESLIDGLYFLEIKDNGIVSSFKFVKN